jgi:hypothetical protein
MTAQRIMSHSSPCVTILFIFASSLPLKLRAVWRFQILDAPMKYSEVNVHLKHNKIAPHQHHSIISQWNSHNFAPLSHRQLHQITLRTATDTSNITFHCFQFYRLKEAINWTALCVVPEHISISYRQILPKSIMSIICKSLSLVMFLHIAG